MLIHDLFESGRAHNPQQTFLNFEGDHFTYEEFFDRIHRTANALRNWGIKPGDRVAVYLENCPEFLELFFATSYTGSVLAPSNPDYKERELRHSITLSAPRLLITSSELEDTARAVADDTSLEEILTIDTSSTHRTLESFETSEQVDPVDHKDDAVALHMYTSGTTGPPKAVEITHFNYTHAANDFAKRMGFAPSDNVATCLPLFHANAQVYTTLGACAAGSTVVLIREFSTSQWWEWMREYEVTEFNAMGSMLKMLDNVETDREDNPVNQIFSAGTPPELIEPFEARFGLRVVEGYSLTEDVLLILNPTEPQRRRIGSIGLPPAEKRIKIVDEDGESVSRGEKGEIIMDCPCTMAGYHDQPDKTDEAIQDGWFYTGDYGKLDDDGFVYFIDRKKNIIRRSGENISSYEVEGVIKSLEAVDEVAVIPTPDEFRTEEVKAMVKLKEGAELEPEDIVGVAKEELASFKTPRYVEFVDTFPYTPTQKIQKSKLREREKEESLDHWDREA
jgi:crotonobetaine/carnitine-CoA ligase